MARQRSARRVLPIAVTVSAAGLALAPGAAGAASARKTAARTPAELVAAARAATLSATDVTITVREEVGGQPVAMTVSGRYPTFVHAVVLAANESEGIVVRGGTTYFEANSTIWESGFKLSAIEAASLAGKWFTTKDADPLLDGSTAAVSPTAIETSLFASMHNITVAPGEKIRIVRLGGKPAFSLADKEGAIYIAATGKPYLLRISSHSSAGTGFAQFSAFDAPLVVTLPSSAGNLDSALSTAEAASSTTTTTLPASG